MRYVIATTEPAVFSKLNAWAKEKKLTISEKGDVIEKIHDNVRNIKEAVEAMRRVGISDEVMHHYIHSTTGISHGTIKDVLTAQKQFFDKLGGK